MSLHQKIVPCLWFNHNALEAANFYVSVFPNSKINNINTLRNTLTGDVGTISFELWGNQCMALNAESRFQFNEAISFYVYCGAEAVIEQFYQKLLEGGSILMPLGQYPWSSKYAWIKDRFGLNWQLDIDSINAEQKIVPSLLFANEKKLQVKAASSFYHSIFKDSRVIMEAHYDPSANLPSGTLLFTQFRLNGQIFNAMSSTLDLDFDFNEAFSFMVHCDTQAEIDDHWHQLSVDGSEQPCGWLKDQFGISWQVVPIFLEEILASKDQAIQEKVIQALLPMKKIEIKTLRKAIETL